MLEQAAIHQRVPRPRLGEWWRDVLTRVAEFVAGIFDLSSATIRSLLTVASWGLIALAAVVLLGWAVSFLLRLRAAREAPASAGTTVSVSLEDAAAEDWERRLRDALAGANISEALRAQWQVLFTRLPAPTSADRSGQRPRTTRTLRNHLRAKSRSAASALRRLERWTYGGQRPAVDELRELQGEFEHALPRRMEPES